jgi:DNA repair protein RecN (Recombination protein N)
LGEQLKGDVFFDTSKNVELEATFDIKSILNNANFRELVNTYEIDISEQELFFARELKPDGRSTVFINGRKSTNAIVKEFRSIILDFHSQRDQQSLFDEDTQLLYLDNFADILALREEFLEVFTQWQEVIKKLKKYQDEIKANEEKILLYQYQIEELETAKLRENEESELDSEHNLLTNAKEIIDLLLQMKTDFYESERTVLDIFAFYKNKLQNYVNDSKLIAEIVENLTSCVGTMEDIAVNLRAVDEAITVDEKRLEEVESRIKLIYDLKNKYKKNIAQMNEYVTEMNNFIANFRQNVEEEEGLKKEIEKLQQKTFEIAEFLHQKRIAAARVLEQNIVVSLQKLAIKDADFKIVVDKNGEFELINSLPDISCFNQAGFNRVRYIFSANKGSALQDLKSTISGGELSRLLLVIKSILAKKLPERTIIFDEIDSGIGGNTANMLGEFIKELSQNHQIICISHLPQIAAIADNHLKIEKISTAEKNIITVKVLDDATRREEIARMLSGNITNTALEHAEELLKRVRKE